MLVSLRQTWSGQIAEVRRMRDWVLQAEHILAGQWATPQEPLTNATVALRFDSWCEQIARLAPAPLGHLTYTPEVVSRQLSEHDQYAGLYASKLILRHG